MSRIAHILSIILLSLAMVGCSTETKKKIPIEGLTWTYTYIKAEEGKRKELKEILIKNWFAMDSIAVQQELINDYELIENLNTKSDVDWDYIVAVEYFTEYTYKDISVEFDKIRQAHQTVKINGLTFPQAGKVVKSETVKKSH
jgi:hypothetical protein